MVCPGNQVTRAGLLNKLFAVAIICQQLSAYKDICRKIFKKLRTYLI